jgi:hypothetical protein
MMQKIICQAVFFKDHLHLVIENSFGSFGIILQALQRICAVGALITH